MQLKILDADTDAAQLVDRILKCYLLLCRLPKLEPSPQVNCLFEELVSLCCQTHDEMIVAKVLTDSKIIDISTHLRHLCSQGEYQLEAHWVSRMLKQENQEDGALSFQDFGFGMGLNHISVRKTLLEFPYHKNYVDLVRMELNALTWANTGICPRNFAIFGSGPLPMTALCICRSVDQDEKSAVVHNFDWDPRAISSSTELYSKLGESPSQMLFECRDAQDETLDLHSFDVVYVAALVGITTAQKADVVSSVARRMRLGALLILRSSHSLRSLLYPAVSLSAELISSGVTPLIVIHPYNDIVNSVVIARIQPPTGEQATRRSSLAAST